MMHTMPQASGDVERCLKQWLELADRQDDPWMREAAQGGEANALLISVFLHSPYLLRLLLLYPGILQRMLEVGADATQRQLAESLDDAVAAPLAQPDFMRALRVAKNKLALLAALADLGKHWTLAKVTSALSEFAEQSLSLTVDFLLSAAHARGEIILP